MIKARPAVGWGMMAIFVVRHDATACEIGDAYQHNSCWEISQNNL